MELFVLYKCGHMFSLLITAAICVQCTNAISANETDLVPHTLDVLRGSLHTGIGPASPLSHNAGSDNLVTMVEQQTNSAPFRRRLGSCQLWKTCNTNQFNECNFKGCEQETYISLRGHGLWGTIPANLNTFLPNVEFLWVVAPLAPSLATHTKRPLHAEIWPTTSSPGLLPPLENLLGSHACALNKTTMMTLQDIYAPFECTDWM